MPGTPTEKPRPPPLRMPETREVMTSDVHKMLEERRQGTFTRLSQDQYEDMDLTIHEDQQVLSPADMITYFPTNNIPLPLLSLSPFSPSFLSFFDAF